MTDSRSAGASIFDLDLPEITALLGTWGEPAYRARQIWQGLYHQLYVTPEQFSTISKNLRQKLAEHFGCADESGKSITFSRLKPTSVLNSSDGETRKTLFELPDGRLIEAVLMRYERRRTLCISTQSGCAMGCVFCATGQMGFFRQLSSGEILEQVLFYARQLAPQDEKVTNVVIMGMGEPFHNYEATMQAVARLNQPDGFNLGARRFTISTVGLAPAIRRFAEEGCQVNLAVSLHAANDQLRTSMLPINRRYPLEALFEACLYYVQKTRRRLTFEWALIEGINDTPDQARQLAQRLQPFHINQSTLCHVNAIPLNPTHRYDGKPTTQERARAFQAELEQRGIPCTIRLRRGIDIQAGCGQLAGSNLQAL